MTKNEFIYNFLTEEWASLVAQLVKNMPAIRETWVGMIPGRRESLPTPVFWPREFHGLYSPWGRKGWDKTEHLSLHFHTFRVYIRGYLPKI